jgi:hypothetical protein
MINVQIVKVDSWQASFECANPNCQHLPEYIEYIPRQSLWVGEKYYLKAGTTCAVISLSGFHIDTNEYYCRGCIDEVYQMIKSKMDTKLWAFQ